MENIVNNVNTAAPIVVKNLWDKYPQLFTSKAKEVVTSKNAPTIILEVNGKKQECRYFSAQVAIKHEEALLKEMADMFNDLCEKDMIAGVLCPPYSVELANFEGLTAEGWNSAVLKGLSEGGPLPKTMPATNEVIFFYVHINETPENNEYIKGKYGQFEVLPGQMGVKKEY
jgi:hypothetical protein